MGLCSHAVYCVITVLNLFDLTRMRHTLQTGRIGSEASPPCEKMPTPWPARQPLTRFAVGGRMKVL